VILDERALAHALLAPIAGAHVRMRAAPRRESDTDDYGKRAN